MYLLTGQSLYTRPIFSTLLHKKSTVDSKKWRYPQKFPLKDRNERIYGNTQARSIHAFWYPHSVSPASNALMALSMSLRFGSVTDTPMCPNRIYLGPISL